MVKSQVRLTILIYDILIFSVIFPYFQGSKIILHFKTLYISSLQHINVHGYGLYITLFIWANGFLQHIESYRNMVNPMWLRGWDWMALGIQFQISVIIILIAT